MLASKLTSKFQATVPLKVREALQLKKGDIVGFEIAKNNVVYLKKATPIDLNYARSIEKTLSEWESAHDEEAYRDL